jgi:hypothetical protein
MALTNYNTLVAAKTAAGSIKRQVNYAHIDSEVVLENAQTLLYSMLRVREMRALATLTMSVGDSTKALPGGYLDPNGALTSGQPTFWTVLDELIQFDVKFATQKTLYLAYYKQPDLLTAEQGTNWLTNRYPHLLRQSCTVQAHAFMKNWAGYNEELEVLGPMVERVNVEADLSYRGADLDQDTP